VKGFFLRIFDLFQRRKSLCFWLMAGMIGCLLAMMASLTYNENIFDFLPVSGNEQKAITLYQDISGGQRIFTMFKLKDGGQGDDETLTNAVDTFAHLMQPACERGQITEITTQIDFEKVSGITDFIYDNMPLMLRDSDYVRMERILSSPEMISEQLANDVQMVMMPAPGLFSANISKDPLGLFSPVIDRLQSRQSAVPIEFDNGYIYSPGKEYGIAMMTSPYGAMESANNSRLVEHVDSMALQTMEAVPDVEVYATGAPVIAVGNAAQIKKDSQWAISISVTLILLLLVFSFRRVKNLLLIGVAIIFGWLFAMGFMAVVRSDVSLIVLGIGSIIIGIAVNYPLHFIAHTDHGGTVREVLKEMISPLLIGNITTVGAFASLIPLDAPALRDLGLFAAFMLVGTIFFVLIFLPHLVKKRVGEAEERLTFGRISSMSPERHRWLLWVILALTVVFGWYSLDTSFDTNMHHINYMTESQTKLLSSMHASAGLNDTVNVYLVTEGESWDEALNERQRLAPLLDSLQKAGALNQYSDVTSLICSSDEQKRRIEKWNAFWEKHRESTIGLLKREAPRYGFSDDAFSDFETITAESYAPKTFEQFEPIRSVLMSSSFSTSTGPCSVVDVIDARDKDLAPLEDALNERLGEKGYAFDFMRMNSAIANSLSSDFNYIGFACGLIVFIFLWISFGRLELSLLAFLPMALGWIWILGIMSMLGMQFNIVNVILATFIFGQGDDYTIFITDGLINEFAYKKKLLPSFKNSIMISALIMFIGMGSLIVARHPALHSLAEVTIVGMFTVVLMAWVIPPLIFGWMVKTDNQVRRSPVTLDHVLRIICGTIVYILQLVYGVILGFLTLIIPDKSGRIERWFHGVIHRTLKADATHIWGVKFNVHNQYEEDFSRGSIMICNHQSMLDPIYILSLSPRILITAGSHVWKNPIVNPMFKLSRFLDAGEQIEELKEKIEKSVREGYNVLIFPEGLRSEDAIKRFKQGAFYLAGEIGADILPLYLHGAGHVMPKGSGFASRGQVDLEIGKRIPASELMNYGPTYPKIAHAVQREYEAHYQQMKTEIEKTHYFHHYVIDKYTYKGIGVERETRRLLKKYDDFSAWIDGYTPVGGASNEVSVIHAGRGQFSLLFALVHPEIEVYSYADTTDDYDLAKACEPLPANLHIRNAMTESVDEARTHVINLNDILEI
jgi:Acyltransferase./MMPL family.